MKLSNLTLVLIAAMLLSPTVAHARNDTDAIRESFGRAFSSGLETRNQAVNPVAGSDLILASFERGLYGEPAALQTISAGSAPDLMEVINVVAFSKAADPVNASFLRDLNRGITVCEYLNSAQLGGTLAC